MLKWADKCIKITLANKYLEIYALLPLSLDKIYALNLPQDFTQWRPFNFKLIKHMLVHCLLVYSPGIYSVCLSIWMFVDPRLYVHPSIHL